jgi:hypothetical protein
MSHRVDRAAADKPQTSAAVDEARAAAMAPRIRALFAVQMRARRTILSRQAGPWGEGRMPRWDGGPDRRGRIHRSVWEEIARSCLEHGLDPRALVEAHFDARFIPDGLPKPGDLAGGPALRRYREYVDECENPIRVELKCGINHVENSIYERQRTTGEGPLRAAFMVLGGSDHDHFPLLCYCLGLDLHLVAVVEKYHVQALRQYVERRYAYDRVWGEKIPAGLRADADAFFARCDRQGAAGPDRSRRDR